ncbi:flavodoxin [Sutcliffiella horikoshii]|uniref:Flavodoxin n=1 Tax=Sutcliffiella horikoshii TaxID=79883 RepID=A0A5D4SVJ0_9BACI|nr:flavodoxin [Sutcliffiella horikoshii]TYS67423.1 flavodoxin [Sutcliffiella horikoshii]
MRIGIFYASMSGNTEAIADSIAEKLKSHQHEVVLEDLHSVDSAEELLHYDITILGMYTWGDGDYPDECLDLVDELEEMDLEGHPFAIFGSGDTSYPEFCGALHHLKELLESRGGSVFPDPLKIEFNPEPEDEVEITKFVSEVVGKLKRSA